MGYVREHWNYLTEPGAYPGVDLLRAAAVTLVLLYHFQLWMPGWVGVDLFFVISGFLIGGIILDKAMSGTFSMSDFYMRRALRILPVYYFVIVLVAVFKAKSPIDWVAIKSLVSGMFFLHTTGPYFFPGFFSLNNAYLVGGAWSLVIEEMFYLLAPLVLLAFVRVSRRNLVIVSWLVTGVVGSGILTRILMTSSFSPDDSNWHFASFIQFHSRYDELAAGVLAACLVRVVKSIRLQSAWWLAGGGILVWMFLTYLYGKPAFLANPALITRDTVWLPTLLAAMGVALLLGSFWLPIRVRPVIVLARLSYPLYLMHILFIECISPYGNGPFLAMLKDALSFYGRSLVLLLTSVVIAYLTSLLVEYPFVRYYKKAPRKRSAEPAPDSVVPVS